MTEAANYTPGPWKPSNSFGAHIVGADGTNVAVTLNTILATKRDLPVPTDIEQVKANACLIAAAPSLLTSLKEMLAVYWGEGDGQFPEPACIQNARAAIEAATPS